MGCYYLMTEDGKVVRYDSYAALHEAIKARPELWDKIVDALYAKSGPEEDAAYFNRKLRLMKEEKSRGLARASAEDDATRGDVSIDPHVMAEGGEITVGGLVGWSEFDAMEGDEVGEFDRKAFAERTVSELKAAGRDIKDAEKAAEAQVKNWDKQCRNACDFHMLINKPHMKGTVEENWSKWTSEVASTSFKGERGMKMVADAEQKIFNIVNFASLRDKTRADSVRPTVHQNVSFEADLKNGPDGVGKIVGHADYITVRDDGTLDVYKVVSSAMPTTWWANRRNLTRYRYEMALDKLILAQNGFNVTDIRLNVIPVQLEYGEGFDEISGISVADKAVRVDMEGGVSVLDEYEATVAKYVQAAVSPVVFRPEAFGEVSEIMGKIIPGVKVGAEGTALEAADWVRRNWDRCRPARRTDGKPGWVLHIPTTNEEVVVGDSRPGRRNEEFIRWVDGHINGGLESVSGRRSARAVLGEVMRCYSGGRTWFETDMDLPNKAFWTQMVSEYLRWMEIRKDPETGKDVYDYQWKPVENDVLTGSNLLVFQNQITKQLDVICVTQNDPGRLHRINGRRNLLGKWLIDANSRGYMTRATWGNIEMLRMTALLNQVIADLGPEVRLGKAKVVCMSPMASMHGQELDFETLVKDWGTVVDVVNGATGGAAGLKDNFAECGTRCMTAPEIFIQRYRNFRDYGGDNSTTAYIRSLKSKVEGTRNALGEHVPGLVDAETWKAKIDILEDIMGSLKTKLQKDTSVRVAKVADLVKTAEMESDSPNTVLSSLYVAAAEALNRCRGYMVPEVGELKSVEANIMRPEAIANDAVSNCVNLVQTTINIVSSRLHDTYDRKCKPAVDRFRDASGYGKARNLVLGDQTKMYRNLYEYDSKGRNMFIFKNPYDSSSRLLDHERAFLKTVLYEIYLTTCRMNGASPTVGGPEDPSLYKSLPKGYLDVPLQKASKVSERADLKSFIRRKWDGVKRAVTHPIDTLKSVWGALTDTGSLDITNDAFESMTMYNKYAELTGNNDRRANAISEKGEWYYETNVENILLEYLHTQIRIEEMDSLLKKINAIEIGLNLHGKEYGDKAMIERITDYIDKYTKVNVHNGTIMEKESTVFTRATGWLRKLVTEVFFANNLYGLVRDNIDGLYGNFSSAVMKYDTHISPGSLAKAYYYVWRDSLKSVVDLGKLNALNMRYGFSSFDFGRPQVRMRSEGGWIHDWSKWMYWTMKEPDYLNRMTLFVARTLEDGSFDAYEFDADKNVVYNWRKDGRFSLLARDDGSDPRFFEKLSETDRQTYLKQQGLYYDMIDAFNGENIGKELKYTDNLPDGYTMKDINEIKNLGNKLYGAYNKASWNMLEHTALGRNFMAFFNFLNGVNDVYMKGLSLDPRRTVTEQKVVNGKKVFRLPNGGETTEDTGVPVTVTRSMPTQGIVPTLIEAFNFLRENDWDFKAYRDQYIKENEMIRANYRKLCFDMVFTAIFSAAFFGLVKPAYKRRKEEMDPQALAENICVELLYRGWARSGDYYTGPLAVLKYFGDSTNPVMYDMGYKIIQDTFNLIAGKKAFGETALSYSALYRSMQDSVKAFYRDMARQNGTADEEEARKREKEQRKGKTGTVR